MHSKYYIDTDNSCGVDAYGNCSYANLNALLEHMDYLQIDKSIVYHQEAISVSPSYGNKRLLKELSELSESQRRRLIPSLVVAPKCFYENGALDIVKEFLERGDKALSIFPETFNFTSCEISRVLDELLEYEPVVFCPVATGLRNRNDFAEFRRFAKERPNTQFVLTRSPSFSWIMDILHQTENVYVDIVSQTMNAVETLVQHGDPSRILFGRGGKGKASNGGAIATLSHAEIDAEVKERIAHENIERLLGLEPMTKNLYATPDLTDKKLWAKFREGHPIDDVEIIDVHCHSTPVGRSYIIPCQDDLSSCVEVFNKQREKAGVDRMFVIPQTSLHGHPKNGITENERVFGENKHYSGLLVFNPNFEELYTKEFFDEAFASGYFKGLKILPGKMKVPTNDERYDKCWAYAHSRKLPILMHTWNKVDIPDDFEKVIEKHPAATFILGHSGGSKVEMRERAESLAIQYDNVYLEFCGSFCLKPWEDTLKTVPHTKVLFGSDTIAHSQIFELGRLLSIPVADEIYPDILAGNLKRILARSEVGL